ETEAAVGSPFKGRAGAVLNRGLYLARIQRKDVNIHNIINCQPPNNWLEGAPWEQEAIEHCSQYIQASIKALRPKAIVALGNVALQALTGYGGISAFRGYWLPGFGVAKGYDVMPTFHPSFIGRERSSNRSGERMKGGMDLLPALVNDIRKADAGRKPSTTAPRYEDLFPTPAWFGDFVRHAKKAPWCAADIETLYSKGKSEEDLGDEEAEKEEQNAEEVSYTILRASFSADGWSITVPWQEPYVSLASALLRSEVRKVFWNYRFDVPRLRRYMPVAGVIEDAMWLWHLLWPDMPKRLAFVAPFYTEVGAWKHLHKENEQYYSWMDAEVTAQCYVQIKERLKALGMERLA
ncbi:MAG: uracil-DNA glycosylase family protein, partial [Patescibacteria group bacterium]